MDAFNYRDGQLFAEGVALSAIAERFGTPTYVYSRAHIEAQYRSFADALEGTPSLVCYAVKANSNLGVLNVLARLGAGFDIVSRGELERVLAAGGQADKIVFSGVGKSREDMRRALEVGVHCFNVESTDELERLQVVAAEMGVRAPISLRVNPDVDAGTHPYISTGLKENKFGIAIADAEDVYIRAAQLPNLEVLGVDCHIGSQLTTLPPFIDALDRLLALVDRLGECGIYLHHIDLGGGVGVRYRDEEPPLIADYIQAVRERIEGRGLTLMFEPGRYIVANAGVLLTQVEDHEVIAQPVHLGKTQQHGLLRQQAFASIQLGYRLAATHFKRLITVHQHLGGTAAGVVVGAHDKPVGTGRMHGQQITFFQGQLTILGQEVAGLADRADDVVGAGCAVARRHGGDVHPGLVQGRADQIVHRRINDGEILEIGRASCRERV